MAEKDTENPDWLTEQSRAAAWRLLRTPRHLLSPVGKALLPACRQMVFIPGTPQTD